jgi:carboxyl-terminal processing protease
MRIGLKAGDKILKIDDKSADGLLVEEAVNLIRGAKGTEVRLTIARDGWSEVKEFKIIRDIINIPIVELEMKQVGDKKIAYLALYQFTENSVSEFEKAIQEVFASGAKRLVLDLRGNPGGYLESAVQMASWFLPEGEIVVIEDYGDGKKEEHKSTGINKLNSLPTVI